MSQPFVPREYQRIAADFIYRNKRCNLWAVPGLGKTSTVYMVLETLRILGSNFFPVLVVAPKRVAELVWPSEQKKWSCFEHLRVVPILGTPKQRDAALAERAQVYVINYENIEWLVARFPGDKWPFKIVVADEATRLKNFRLKQGGKRSSALASIAQRTGRWINLTGTPSPNGLKDLWGQLYFTDFGSRLGHSYTAFMDRWFTVNQYDHSITPRAGADKEIHAKIADVSLALRAEDWLPVSEPNYFVREVELPPAVRKQYDELEKEFFLEIGSTEITALNAAALSQKLLQMAAGAVYDREGKVHQLHDVKMEALQSLIDELGGEPLLVAYWYKFEIPLLQEAFPGFRVFKTAKDEKDWNAGKIPLMGVHPASAGHGVNLQYGGRAMAHLTPTWDLELWLQVCERIGPVRQLQSGLNRAVLHYNIRAKATLDEEVIERRTSKRSIQDALLLARAHRGPMAGVL